MKIKIIKEEASLDTKEFYLVTQYGIDGVEYGKVYNCTRRWLDFNIADDFITSYFKGKPDIKVIPENEADKWTATYKLPRMGLQSMGKYILKIKTIDMPEVLEVFLGSYKECEDKLADLRDKFKASNMEARLDIADIVLINTNENHQVEEMSNDEILDYAIGFVKGYINTAKDIKVKDKKVLFKPTGKQTTGHKDANAFIKSILNNYNKTYTGDDVASAPQPLHYNNSMLSKILMNQLEAGGVKYKKDFDIYANQKGLHVIKLSYKDCDIDTMIKLEKFDYDLDFPEADDLLFEDTAAVSLERPAGLKDVQSSLYYDHAINNNFWADAKNNLINPENFHLQYDSELSKLKTFGSRDAYKQLFDKNTGLFINKSSYSKVKEARAEADSYATKALLKLWLLQFKDNAVSYDEAQAYAKAVETAEAKDFDEKAKAAYSEFLKLNDNNELMSLADVQKLLKQLGERAVELEITTDKSVYLKENKLEFALDLNTYRDFADELYRVAEIKMILTLGSTATDKIVENIELRVDKLEGQSIYSEVESRLIHTLTRLLAQNKLFSEAEQKLEQQKADAARIAAEQEAEKKELYRLSRLTAEVGADAAYGLEPDRDSLDLLKDILLDYNNKIKSEVSVWEGSTDGSAELSREIAEEKVVSKLQPHFNQFNWQLINNNKVVASYAKGDSLHDYQAALIKLVYNINDNSQFKVFK